MDTLTQAEIVAAYEAKVITAERAMALLSDAKNVQPARQVQPVMQAKTLTEKEKHSRRQVLTLNSRKKWTGDEIEQLRSLRAVETPYKHCAKIFKRSPQACIRRQAVTVGGRTPDRRKKGGMLL